MTPLPPELEALMPEPVGFRTRYRSEPEMIGHYPWSYADAGRRRQKYDRPEHEYEDLFSADQVRQAMLDATERAAKKAVNLATDAAIKYVNLPELPTMIPEGTPLAHAVREYARQAAYDYEEQQRKRPDFADGWHDQTLPAHGLLPFSFVGLPEHAKEAAREYAEEYARRVRAQEREACAAVCEARAENYRTTRAPGWHEVDHECTQCAAAIRGGGQG